MSAGGIEGETPSGPANIPCGNERPRLAASTETKILQRHQHQASEVIIDLYRIDIRRCHTGALEQAGGKGFPVTSAVLRNRHVMRTECTIVPAGIPSLCRGENAHRLSSQITRAFQGRHNQCAGTVVFLATVEESQRRSDEA